MKINRLPPDWVIEKRKSRRGRPDARYPFADLQVGETFAIPVDEQTCTFRSFQIMASDRGRRLGRQFYVRQLENGDFECWRDA